MLSNARCHQPSAPPPPTPTPLLEPAEPDAPGVGDHLHAERQAALLATADALCAVAWWAEGGGKGHMSGLPCVHLWLWEGGTRDARVDQMPPSHTAQAQPSNGAPHTNPALSHTLTSSSAADLFYRATLFSLLPLPSKLVAHPTTTPSAHLGDDRASPHAVRHLFSPVSHPTTTPAHLDE